MTASAFPDVEDDELGVGASDGRFVLPFCHARKYEEEGAAKSERDGCATKERRHACICGSRFVEG